MTGLYSELGYPQDAVLRMLEQIADARHRHAILLSGIGVVVRSGRSLPVESVAEAIGDAIDDGCARFQVASAGVDRLSGLDRSDARHVILGHSSSPGSY